MSCFTYPKVNRNNIIACAARDEVLSSLRYRGASTHGSLLAHISAKPTARLLERAAPPTVQLYKYLMARPPRYTFPETAITPDNPCVTEEPSGVDIQTEGDESVGHTDNFEMSDPAGSGEKPDNYGKNWSSSGGASSSSFKYSHEETRPEKINEKMKDLHDDMQDTLRRLDNLEAKLKNGAGKRRKKPSSNSARRNEELEKALSNMMKGAGDDESK